MFSFIAFVVCAIFDFPLFCFIRKQKHVLCFCSYINSNVCVKNIDSETLPLCNTDI